MVESVLRANEVENVDIPITSVANMVTLILSLFITSLNIALVDVSGMLVAF